MADKQETSADIIAEMRFHGQQNIDAEKDKPEYGILTMEGRITQNYADRLEAAYKREVDALEQRRKELVAEVAAKDEVIKRLNDAIAEEQRRKMATTENSSAVGDAAKLREAVTIFVHDFASFREDVGNGILHAMQCMGFVKNYIPLMESALAAPARNCDVGTAEEQADRFQKFCLSRTQPWHGCDGTCPVLMSEKCALNWAQMPYERYEEGGAK